MANAACSQHEVDVLLPHMPFKSAMHIFRRKVDNNFHSPRDAFRRFSGSYEGAMDFQTFCKNAPDIFAEDFVNEAYLRPLFTAMDHDKDGAINYGDFLRCVSEVHDYAPFVDIPDIEHLEGMLTLEAAWNLLFLKVFGRFTSIQESFLGICRERLRQPANAITPEDFHAFLDTVGLRMFAEDEEELFKRIDTNGDGVIDYQEWENVLIYGAVHHGIVVR
ncbi:unnamed protein product [Vitrella brassicaformis CCMP3155]|uniref:EF-hand domain-containing protein n=2 Tax=Vitrella brassicaformis TaxID=1169539 RepID=A0A0G4ETN6_VITBC|nr:unnamed protein product [Vitrella brassicaformis CCMP3155]|eukprot:CEM01607.1 unnamed protein product [Vitrella brassicaformis CCMP3155]